MSGEGRGTVGGGVSGGRVVFDVGGRVRLRLVKLRLVYLVQTQQPVGEDPILIRQPKLCFLIGPPNSSHSAIIFSFPRATYQFFLFVTGRKVSVTCGIGIK